LSTERHQKGSQQWIEFSKLQKFSSLKHATFLKPSDFGDYANAGKEFEEQTHFCNQLLGSKELVFTKQVHSNAIYHVTPSSRLHLPEADAIITKERHVALGIRHADCQACILFDPVDKALAVIHCGWKGNVLNIYQSTIARLKKEFGSNPKNLIAVISPSLGPQASEFKNFKEEFPEDLWEFKNQSDHFNLWALAKKQLLDCGLLEDNIELAELCTLSAPKDFHSYRRNKTLCRHATIACLQ
jgi:polyphenol oxidase